MKSNTTLKTTPPKNENLKLKEKSQAFSDVTHVSQRSYQFNTASHVKVLKTLFQHLNLDVFKISPCNITKNHNHKHCINYHSAKDRRRYMAITPEMCHYIKQGEKCP